MGRVLCICLACISSTGAVLVRQVAALYGMVTPCHGVAVFFLSFVHVLFLTLCCALHGQSLSSHGGGVGGISSVLLSHAVL